MSLCGTHPGAGVAGTALAVGLACTGAADASQIATVAGETCRRPGYAYAGYESAVPARGIAATLSAAAVPSVEAGHAAAWVGVSQTRARGDSQWIQVGLASFSVARLRLYVEVMQPGTGSHYSEIAPEVPPRVEHRIAVVEVPSRPDWWHALVDGRTVSPPVQLPGSSGNVFPIATAETSGDGTPACNRFEFRFEHVSTIGRRGRVWRHFVPGARFQDPGYRVVRLHGGTGFLARAARTTH